MFHYLFPPLTIGLSGLLVSLEWKFLRTQDRQSETAAKFWTKLYAAVYAMSVATGITMEFQFGTDWVTYSRYVDDIFGDAPFPDLIHSSLNPRLESDRLQRRLLSQDAPHHVGLRHPWDAVRVGVHGGDLQGLPGESSTREVQLLMAGPWGAYEEETARLPVNDERLSLTISWEMVGTAGFEPATSWSRTKRASQTALRPVPERRE